VKRFQFPLDRVRRWRSEQADLEELKLGQLRDRLTALGEEKQKTALDCARSQQQVMSQPLISPAELGGMEYYRHHTRGIIAGIENRQRQVGEEIAQQLQKVIAARQQAELLERLKQKSRAQWQSDVDREQETLATELYLAKRARRPSPRGSSGNP
jgi:hypothetical protein